MRKPEKVGRPALPKREPQGRNTARARHNGRTKGNGGHGKKGSNLSISEWIRSTLRTAANAREFQIRTPPN